MTDFLNRVKLKLNRVFLFIRKKVFNLKMRLTGNTRPHSYPYITSDTFRFMADHIYDKVDENTKVSDINKGDIVFVDSFFSKNFFKFIHPQIKNPYILITHNGIESVNEDSSRYIDDKIIHWFAKNVLIENDKVTPLPIGMENLYKYGTGIIGLYNKNRPTKYRKNKILYHFKIATNPDERQKAYNYISNHPIAETFPSKLPPPLYLNKLSEYKFVLSPPGAGEECHRTWEALYIGVVPIVKKCAATEYFSKIGVPMWVVDNWYELDNIDTEFLEKKYNELMDNKNTNALYMDYWIQKIAEKSNKGFSKIKRKFI